MNLALWIVAGLLAAAYLFSGGAKLIVTKEKMAGMSTSAGWVGDFSAGSVKAIGALEVLAAAGLRDRSLEFRRQDFPHSPCLA